MKKAIIRISLVGVIHILMFELLCQLSVHWRESTEELAGTFLLVLLLIGLIWGALPAFGKLSNRTIRIICRVALIVVLFAGLYTVAYFYFWHIRPNLGFYQEPDWVAQHPGFQRQLRTRIEANKWIFLNKPDASGKRGILTKDAINEK